MKRPLRFTLILVTLAAAFAVLASSAYAGAFTYFASPTGSGDCKSAATPCKLEKAVEVEALNEDTVVVEPGTYTLASELVITHEIEIGGQPGAAQPVIVTKATAPVRVGVGIKATIHDLRLEGAGALSLNSGSANRVFVSYTGTGQSACSVTDFASRTPTIRDSVCWAHNGATSTGAINVDGSTGGTVSLRNDTLISDNAEGNGLHAQGNGGKHLTVEVFNSIFHGHHGDVEAITSGVGAVFSAVKLTDSNYVTAQPEGSTASVTAAGTNGNQTSAPTFANAAAGDFREVAGSPTIDAGINDPLNGATDLAGDPRSLGACIGGAPITDIGAYEFVPTVACPVPVPPVSNEFTIGKLTLNKKQGVGTLAVKLPDAGKLTLSGKGVKKVTRSANGAATLKLPVKPVGKWKKALLETGKLKVSLKLKFVPTGGSAAEKSKKATLKETVH